MKHSMLLSAAAAALVLAAGCAKAPEKPPEEPAAAVSGDKVTYPAGAPQLSYITVEAARPRRLAVSHLTGRLFLADDATVRVFTPVAGQISALRVDVGDNVAAGAPLAEIASPDYYQALADARAAEAAYASADKALARGRDLLEHGAAAAKDVEAAEAAYGSAAAERSRAAARLALYHGAATDQGSAYVLRAPISGVVVERNANPGQEVRADQMLANATNLFAPLFVVSDISRLWLQVDASEADLSELSPGEAIEVSSNAYAGRLFTGTITNIAPALDPSTHTVRVRGVVANPDHALKAEMYVTADVVRPQGRVGSAGADVPSKTIFTVDRKAYLFAELAPGQFERRQVTVGVEKDGVVPVLSGLAPGTRVVTDGGLLLQSVLDPDN